MTDVWDKLQQATRDSQFVSLMQALLTPDYTQRSSDDAIMAHPYLQEAAVKAQKAAAVCVSRAVSSSMVQLPSPVDQDSLSAVPGMSGVFWDPTEVVCVTPSGTMYRWVTLELRLMAA